MAKKNTLFKLVVFLLTRSKYDDILYTIKNEFKNLGYISRQ